MMNGGEIRKGMFWELSGGYNDNSELFRCKFHETISENMKSKVGEALLNALNVKKKKK